MDYKEYINSKEWKERRLAYIKIFGGCEVCEKTKNLHVHHKSYKNLGKEKLEEISVLCGKHHKKVHFSNKGNFRNSEKRNTERIKSMKKSRRFNLMSPMFECNRCKKLPLAYFYSIWKNGSKHFMVVCNNCGVHNKRKLKV